MAVFKWLSKLAQSAVDPNRAFRVDQLKKHIVDRFRQHGKSFTVSQVQLPEGYCQADLADAANAIYADALDRAWADTVITSKERNHLAVLERVLELDAAKAKELKRDSAKSTFAVVLAKAMDDGVISEKELKHLTHIASHAGFKLADFAKEFFSGQCEDFLRSTFLSAIEDGNLDDAEWSNLMHIAEIFGVSEERFFKRVRHQAQSFVEHVLADAKLDDHISDEEEKHLLGLVEKLRLPEKYRKYLTHEIVKIRLLERIHGGSLPSIKAPVGIELVGGEIVHAVVGCKWHEARKRGNEQFTQTHVGQLVLTDRQITFVSESKSFRVSYRSIIGHLGNDRYIQLQAQNKPELNFELLKTDEILYPIFKTALAIANQTKMASTDRQKTRHISRDVRQTVWIRYGGRCADCQATDYLEFDHIIPVAKGGSNTEANVQLLCRRCNNKKSDKI